MNHITMHGSLTVNGRTVIVHMGDGEANATVDGTHFNVRSLWQLYQLLRLLVYRLIKARCPPLVGYRAGNLKTDNVGKCLQFVVDDCKLTSWIVASIQYLIRSTGGPKVRCFVRGVNEMNKPAQSSIESV